MKPCEIKRFERQMNGHRDAAIKKDGKLHRVSSGYYLAFLNGEVVQFSRQRDVAPHWWIAKEYDDNRWHSDPQPTLRALKSHVGIE